MSIGKWMLAAVLTATATEAATAGVGFSVGVAGRNGSFGFSYAQPGYYHRPVYGGYHRGYHAPRVIVAPQYVYPQTVVVPAPTYIIQPAPAPYPVQYPAAPQYQYQQPPQYPAQSPYPTTAPGQYQTSPPIQVPAAPAPGRVPPPAPQPYYTPTSR